MSESGNLEDLKLPIPNARFLGLFFVSRKAGAFALVYTSLLKGKAMCDKEQTTVRLVDNMAS